MKIQKFRSGFFLVMALIILLIVIFFGYGSWKYVNEMTDGSRMFDEAESTGSEFTASKLSPSQTPEGYTEYKNYQLGFRFVYPNKWGNVDIVVSTGTVNGAEYAVLMDNTYDPSSGEYRAATISFSSTDFKSECQTKSGEKIMCLAWSTEEIIRNSLKDVELKNLDEHPYRAVIMSNDHSYMTVFADGEPGVADYMNAYKIVRIPKINVSGVHFEFTINDAVSGGKCETDRLSEDDKVGCLSQYDVDVANTILASLQAL